MMMPQPSRCTTSNLRQVDLKSTWEFSASLTSKAFAWTSLIWSQL